MMEQEKRTEEQTKKAIVEVGRASMGGLIPTDIEQLWRVSTIMCKSGFMPKGMNTPEAVFVAVQMGLEVGLSPMQAVQNIAVINGRPTVWGDAALGICRASGLMADFEEFYEGEYPGDGYKAVCIVRRKGEKKPIRSEFSVLDAQRAGLWKKDGPWQTYPKRMLRMRARGFAIRDAFPDALKGLHIREEAQDYDFDMVQGDGGAFEVPQGVEPEARDIEAEFWAEVAAHGIEKGDAQMISLIEATAMFAQKSNLDVMADFLGKPEEVEKLLSTYRKRKDAKEKLAEHQAKPGTGKGAPANQGKTGAAPKQMTTGTAGEKKASSSAQAAETVREPGEEG